MLDVPDRSPLETYESTIRSIPSSFDEPWFREQLAAWRAGDAAAFRRISERHLGAVFELATQICSSLGADDKLLDAIQAGNAALVDVLSEFRDGTAEEFSQCVDTAARIRIRRYIIAAVLDFRE
ncbi:MAG: hypothetical protein ACREHD_12415 [Pirellulales bacterium]